MIILVMFRLPALSYSRKGDYNLHSGSKDKMLSELKYFFVGLSLSFLRLVNWMENNSA